MRIGKTHITIEDLKKAKLVVSNGEAITSETIILLIPFNPIEY